MCHQQLQIITRLLIIALFCCSNAWTKTWGQRHTAKSLAQCNINIEKGCVASQLKTSLSSLHKQKIKDTVDNPLLNVRGGASSSSYNDDGYYNDGKGDDRGYSNDRYDDNRGSNGSGGRDDYGSSSSYAPDRYEDERGNNSNNGWYDDEGRYHDDYYDDRDSGGRRRRSSSSSGLSKPKIPSALTGSNRKLGILFLSAGAAFTILGITLFFNKTLMRLGNLLFVAGVPLMIGTGRTVGYFLQPKKARATGCLGCGIFLVLVGHPILGILLEVFGLLNLFGNMFPLLMMMAKNVPVLGGLFGSSGKNGSGGGRKERRRRESDYDDGYNDDGRYNDDERYGEDDYRY
uniref:Vesicle transport protein n=1 Tax=Skeletonema marinoi TaxID=267567 RepID=A0A7S2LJI0_9STRA|mmetsp:Transcript_25326/g.43008  ORF Transcript_25326/g.43008 Transcript_25326/m.43008 type:complete len:345 (+) Transcript_25326:160-1194(+)